MQIYETSLSINPEIRNIIRNAALYTGQSSSFLIKKMIKKAYKINNKIILREKLVEYQHKVSLDEFECFRYRINEAERIEFSNARFRLCISISKLLLVGFFLFFRQLINKYIKNQNSGNLDKLFNSYTKICSSILYQVYNFIILIQQRPKKE